MSDETVSCTMCEEGKMQSEEGKMVCDKCGHTVETGEVEAEETDSAM